jgi:predicted AlkP superfamily phosphohydrolase/phosphomutase
MQSVFPPDSIPAWATILTGLGEDYHGVFGHVDYLSQSTPNSTGGYEDELKGRTFFDAASEQGRKVCVVNPFLAYPPWEVNGMMVSGPLGLDAPVLSAGTVAASVPRRAPTIGGIEEYPRKGEIGDFIERTREDIEALVAYSAEALGQGDWDLGFVTFLQLDRVQHFLWRFADQGDSTYPHRNPWHEEIEHFYRDIDGACRTLAQRTGAECVLVVSDHGHGRRCERVINVNELLRRAGIVRTLADSRPWLESKYWLQRAKSASLSLAWRLRLEEQAFALARRLPNKKELKTSSFLHDKGGNLAAASAIGGTNPFGGIEINADGAASEGLTESEVVEMVIHVLESTRVRGQSPFLWIRRRAEMFTGPYAHKFPEVLFEMREEYGVGYDLFAPIEAPNVMHRRISGGHRLTGFLGAVGVSEIGEGNDASVEDVAPTVLSLLGCSVPEDMKGRVVASCASL